MVNRKIKNKRSIFTVDKNKRSDYTGTYKSKKTRPQTVLAHLGRVSYIIFV